MMTLKNWTPRPRPGGVTMPGRFGRLEPLDWQRHRDGLYAVAGGEVNADLWRYMPLGPYLSPEALQREFEAARVADGWETLVIIGADETIKGMVSFMRIREAQGSAEIGAVLYGHALQRTALATEVLYMTARYLFDQLGYRRYEWKCNAANQASVRAAQRFGFTYEGTFRNDMVMKGDNRDTAWFSIIDSEWPAIRAAYEAWLSPSNFDASGQQIFRLKTK
ncbi:GNAT family protein [Asticcacaulis sp. BYS171W]|uniref:GNAT family protein n=1 Tax=Asticcacaulis aquaticus TaxID=2984212 RepID=A0ABT5HUU4_9CAUL|nr:GNAT family protein [Asticcacaulis aquaticus]MDC7683846.1 GNAT family protein [Asticcacaulis aquaticus]